MTFDYSDFFAPLELTTMLMAVVLGAAVGLAVASASRPQTWAHLYWMLVGGIVFFVPLSAIRALQGSPVWERFLASLVLWVTYVGGIYLGERLHRRFRRRP